MRIGRGTFWAAMAVAMSTGLAADDGSWTLTGQGRTVMPLQSTQVKMVAETVVLRPVEPSPASTEPGAQKDLLRPYYIWSADCSFTFQNTSEAPADVLMGFPDTWVQDSWRWELYGDREVPKSHAIRDFETQVDGTAAAVVPKEPDQAMLKTWPDISRVLCWEVHFEPGQTRVVKNRYRFGGVRTVNNSGDNYTRLEYILRTGALWNGPIGSAEIRVYPGGEWRLGSAVLGMSDEFVTLLWNHAVLAPCGFEVEREPELCFVWRMKDLVPKKDIQVVLVTAAFQTLTLPDETEGKPDPRKLRILKNTVFAAHGKSFSDPELKAHFASLGVGPKTLGVACKAVPGLQTFNLFPWEDGLLDKEYAYLRGHWYSPRPDFSESGLSPPEREFIAALDRLMAPGAPPASPPPSQ